MTPKRTVNSIIGKRQTGVSLLELMITLAIGIILIAMATPFVTTTINTYRLRASGGEYSNLLQRARIRAVSDDNYYVTYARTVPYASGINAFVDINNGTGGVTAGTYATAPKADLGVAFNTAASLRPQGAAPNVANLYTQFMPGIAPAAVAINPNAGWAGPSVAAVTFGPRGLPCVLLAAPPGGSCSYTVPGLTPQPVAFETFFQNPTINSWEAVTVNPSGRIRQWRYNTANATWQALD